MKKLILTLLAYLTLGSSAAFAGGFVGMGELTAGAATSGSQSSIQSRSMLYTEAALRLGFRVWRIAPLAEGTYRYLGQTTDPSSVSGTNMGGSGYLLGAGLNIDLSFLSITAMYDFSGQVNLSQQTSGGSTLSYTSPQGFRAVLAFHLSHSWSGVLSYSNINYGSSISNSTTTNLTGDLVNQTTYGLGFNFRF